MKISNTKKSKILTEQESHVLGNDMRVKVSPMKGKHHTEETKRKISGAKKGTVP